MTQDERLLGALGWIARLPLLGEPELARLLGILAADAPRLRLELERRGWVDWILPGTHALDARRLAFVREEALPALAVASGLAEAELPRHLPVRRTDLLERVVRVETAAWLNRFVADLAAAPGLPALELADARSLPFGLPASERWWLPGVAGYGCLRAGSLWAPFFVAWDRAGAPDEHRRKHVTGWIAAAESAAAAWGSDGLPPLLLVAAGESELSVWERALLGAAERAPEHRIDVHLTTARQVAEYGPAAVIWHEPGSSLRSSLVEQVGWGGEPPLWRLRLAARTASAELPRTVRPLREWAPHAAASESTPPAERVAAIALSTDRDQKHLIEWIARHPLLSASELAVVTGVPEPVVVRELDWLARCGTVRVDDEPASEEPVVRRYLVTELGLQLLARRDGVPTARYERYSGVTASRVGGSGTDAHIGVRHREHALGVNRVFVRLAGDAQRAGGRLAVWRNEGESTRRFRHDGRGAWIRPDGSGVLELAGVRRPFLLEYDRGTLDGGDYPAKFEGYRRYFEAEAWESDFAIAPALLFVCSDDRAEARVARAAGLHARELPLLYTTEWRYLRDPENSAGLLGPIWSAIGKADWSPSLVRLGEGFMRLDGATSAGRRSEGS